MKSILPTKGNRNISLYVSGPMNGCPNFNVDKFDQVSKGLRERGYDVINPAELDHNQNIKENKDWVVTETNWRGFLAEDLHHVMDVKAVVVLPGWKHSKGARLEILVGHILGKKIYDSETNKTIQLDVGPFINLLTTFIKHK